MYKITTRNYCNDVRLKLKTGGGCGGVVRGDTYHGMRVVQELRVITHRNDDSEGVTHQKRGTPTRAREIYNELVKQSTYHIRQ